MKDRIRLGVVYPDASGMKIPVEVGHSPIGHTSHDVKLGKHAYWFKSVAEFERVKQLLFTQNSGIIRPVPVWEFLDPEDPDIEGLLSSLKGVPVDGQPDDVRMAFQQAMWRYFEARRKEVVQAHEKELVALNDKVRTHALNLCIGHSHAQDDKPQPAGVDQFYLLGRSLYVPHKVQPTGVPAVFDFSPDKPGKAMSIMDKIHEAHGGRSIRLGKLAEELNLSPEDLRTMIESDERFLPIPPPQWVRRKCDPPK